MISRRNADKARAWLEQHPAEWGWLQAACTNGFAPAHELAHAMFTNGRLTRVQKAELERYTRISAAWHQKGPE